MYDVEFWRGTFLFALGLLVVFGAVVVLVFLAFRTRGQLLDSYRRAVNDLLETTKDLRSEIADAQGVDNKLRNEVINDLQNLKIDVIERIEAIQERLENPISPVQDSHPDSPKSLEEKSEEKSTVIPTIWTAKSNCNSVGPMFWSVQ